MVQLLVQDGAINDHLAIALKDDWRSCPRFWDPVQACFEKCALPYIAAIPFAVATCIVIIVLVKLLPWRLRAPQWTQNIIQEAKEPQGELVSKSKRTYTSLALKLLVTSVIGFLLQVFTVFHPAFRIYKLFPAISWAISSVIIAIYPPTHTPRSLLILSGSIFISQAIVLTDSAYKLRQDDIPIVLDILAAFIALCIIINMPLRDPSLSTRDISPAFGEPTNGLRSPEDNLTLWQYMTVSWMAPLISVGKTRQLHDEDVWSLGYEFKHRLLTDRFKELEGTVIRRLLVANGIDLIFMGILALIELFANFSAPVFLQKILQSMDNPQAPRSAALTYAILSLIVRLVATQSSVFSLWYGRRCYERSRGEMITMLYEKTLSRKVVSISSEAKENGQHNGPLNGAKNEESQGIWPMVVYYLSLPYRACCGRSKGKSSDQDDLATMGKILNIMRFDAYEVAQRFWEFPSLITQPLGIVFSVILIWKLIGWPCLLGVITVFIAQALNAVIARTLLQWEKDRRIASDVKLQKISQLVESIRHLRWYGWQDAWLERIMEARQHELKLRVITALWRSLISVVNVFGSGMFPVAAFYAYTVLAGLPLRVEVAFPALQLFSMLEDNLRELPNLITVLLNAKVSIERIEKFMNEPDKLDAEEASTSSTHLEMKNASFSWPGFRESVLEGITLSFPPGLTVVFGQVGSGKTALLQALLGEADLTAGEYHRTNEMVGYCAQTPWLQSMSIRENILFSSPYDSARYKEVLEACALIPDMANFKHGDLSLVGENGVGLSGGQKARLALARAVYSHSKILFLDDPLSALDHQTAEIIVRRCIKGPLLEGRTTILVTHRTDLCITLADQVIEIHDKHARAIDLETLESNDLSRVKSSESTNDPPKDDDDQQLAAIPDKFIEDEHRAHGGVMLSVYWEYIKAGKLRWWFVLVIVLVLFRLAIIGRNWFLKQWGEAYKKPVELYIRVKNPFEDMPSPDDDILPWLVGYLLISLATVITYSFFSGFSIVIIYHAGKSLFERVMQKCIHATFRFYDVTPVGRLMNRLTSDINTVDGNISSQFQQIAMMFFVWLGSIIIIASVTPLFLIFAILLTVTFIAIFSHFIPTSQSLRRLEMVSLTPLISNFGALTEGLTTIRAFCAQYRFQERVIAVTDNFQKMDHFYWSLQAWLTYRFDALSAISTFLLTILALYTGVTPGMTAFLLTAASSFVISTHILCRAYGQLQMDFVSVERVVELLHLDQEPPGDIDPPAYWPSLGSDIVFEGVSISYAPHLDPALSDVSLTIKGGSTTALIGRTGSGKSTLALALLATTPPTSGRILIDGIDISQVNTQALRSRITFLAQEPVLFPGTMQSNLDPLSEFSDTDCAAVLEKIAGRHNWSLDTHIDSGGRNLSQGQRQLVGLARALLRRSAIVVMDEATASIDFETAGRIQEILREEMKESTVITIAHRVEAVRGADFCVKLGGGRVLEVGKPGEVGSLEMELA
ncbi:ABC transporter-like protein [Bisporella sp. PMI_857]|nr:ABC transporter-like protein [Bisporella sp. PMI_857]